MTLELAGAGAMAFVGSLAACRAIITAGPRDHPDEERKVHNTSTPTSGGLGFGFGAALGMLCLLWAAPHLRVADAGQHIAERIVHCHVALLTSST